MRCKSVDVVIEDLKVMGVGAGALSHSSQEVSKNGENVSNYKAKGQYSIVGEKARLLTPPGLQCALLCGGPHCKYESPLRWPTDQLALQGVYSHWITEDILAMARPSTSSIETWNMIQQFHSWGIRSIINLQAPGEHAHCGPPLEPSGFTYDPNVFMANNIFYYNFAWRDYGAAGLRALLDAVKVLVFAVGEGRVAIHCHAGLGRTGVLVACYLVHALRVSADEAIRRVRTRRTRAVQTACQVTAVHHFEKYLLPQTAVFSIREHLKERNKQQEFGLLQHLHRQKATLHGIEERAFRYLPKIVYCLCERLLRACGCEEITIGLPQKSPTANFIVTRESKSKFNCSASSEVRKQCPCVTKANAGNPPVLSEITPVDVKTPISPDVISEEETLVPRLNTISNQEMGDNINSGQSSLAPSPEDKPGATPSQVGEALLMDHSTMSEERQKYLRAFQVDLNTRAAAFTRINTEDDLRIISALLMEWLENLKMPVLDSQDLATIVVWGEKPKDCLLRLEFEDAILTEYLIRVVSRLRHISCEARAALIRRLAGALCQQGIRVRGVLQPPRSRVRPMRGGTAASVCAFFARLHKLIRSETITCPKCCDQNNLEPSRRSWPSINRSSLIIVQPANSKTSTAARNRKSDLHSRSISLPSIKSNISTPLKTCLSMNDAFLGDRVFGTPVKSLKMSPSLKQSSTQVCDSSNSSIEITLANSNLISTVAECHLD